MTSPHRLHVSDVSSLFRINVWGTTLEPPYKDNRRIKVNCWVTALDCSYFQRRGIHLWRNSYCSMLDPHCSPLLPWWVCQPAVNGKIWPSTSNQPMHSLLRGLGLLSPCQLYFAIMTCWPHIILLITQLPLRKNSPLQHTKQSAYQQDEHFNNITVIVIIKISEVIFTNIVK